MASAPATSHPLLDSHAGGLNLPSAFDTPTLLHDEQQTVADEHAAAPDGLDHSDHVQPHAFLPNLLRNWLWKPPPPRPDKAQRRKQQRRLEIACMQDSQSSQPATAVRRLAKYSSATSTGTVADNDLNLCAVPQCTMYTRPPPLRLGGRSLRKLQAGGSNLSNPSSFALEGALLFVDMSGFTPLSERLGDAGMLGVEALSRCLNDYFGPITELIERQYNEQTQKAQHSTTQRSPRNAPWHAS